MPRPRIDADTLDRLDAAVDERTRVPGSHLTADEQLAFVLDRLDEAERRSARLSDQVDRLEDELEAARAEVEENDTPGLDEIASGSATDLPNGLGPNRR